jgi:electron transfer flavoprotein beta subunit
MTGPNGRGPTTGAVVACLRVADLHPSVDPLSGAVRSEPAGRGLSDAEAAALEHALRAGEAWGAPVAAVCAGPAAVEPVLRAVAAHGARVLRVEMPGADAQPEDLAADERGAAVAVADAIVGAVGRPSLVLCADRSADRGTGAFPAYLAAELGVTQALGLVALSVGGSDRDGRLRGHGGVMAERRLDAGWRERLRVPLPAVCSVEAAGVRLRRAPLDGALATTELPVPVHRAPPVTTERTGPPRPYRPRPNVVPGPPSPDPRQRVLDLCGVRDEREPPIVLGPMSAADAVDELLAFLNRHGFGPVDDPGATTSTPSAVR